MANQQKDNPDDERVAKLWEEAYRRPVRSGVIREAAVAYQTASEEAAEEMVSGMIETISSNLDRAAAILGRLDQRLGEMVPRASARNSGTPSGSSLRWRREPRMWSG